MPPSLLIYPRSEADAVMVSRHKTDEPVAAGAERGELRILHEKICNIQKRVDRIERTNSRTKKAMKMFVMGGICRNCPYLVHESLSGPKGQ